MLAPFTAALTGTSIEQEYRSLASAIARVATAHPAFVRDAYDPRSLARLATHWSERMVDEYGSTAVFGALAAQMMEAGAPLDTTAVTLRMGQDELIHAEACSRVALAAGGNPSRTREARLTPIARHPDVSARERIVRNVVFATCITEMNSVAYFVSSLDVCTDPYLRGVTRQLLADEVLHGSFGFHFLEGCQEWLDDEPGIRASIGRYLRYGFAVAERVLTKGCDVAYDAGRDDEALGLVPLQELPGIFRRTMEEAVVPGLERFGIPAADAWKRRALA